MKRPLPLVLSAGLALAIAAPAAAQPLQTIKTGTVQSFGAIVTYIARDKGYFKELGIEVDISFMNSAANVVALLAARAS